MGNKHSECPRCENVSVDLIIGDSIHVYEFCEECKARMTEHFSRKEIKPSEQVEGE